MEHTNSGDIVNISKKSWHYRVARMILDGSSPSNSLCVYFWQVLFGVLFSALVVAFLIAVVVVLGCGLIKILILLSYPATWPYTDSSYVEGLISAALWVIVAVYCLVNSRERFNKAYRDMKYRDGYLPWYFYMIIKPNDAKVASTKRKEPNLLVEFIKAKKSKVCPILEFTND